MVGIPESPAGQPPEPEVGWMVWVCFTLAFAGSIGLIAAGSGVGGATPSVEVRAAGLIGVLLVLTTLPLTLVMLRRSRSRPDTALRDEIARLQRVISQLSEQSALSDDARRVLNRKRERELLRAAIDEDIAAEDWDAAMVLVKELAEQFGYRSDAEEFRQRIEQARYETVQRKVNESVSRLDGLIMQRRWDQASIEAARIGRLYPDSPKVEGLRHRVEHARQLYKTDLERRFLVSAEENRIAEAMDLLKELDAYLTEAEAEPYREVARGVIGKAKENLGAQFKLAVQDRAWSRAADIGGQIIDQFPNSRMAVEVRQVLDSVRARARDVEVARN